MSAKHVNYKQFCGWSGTVKDMTVEDEGED